MTGVLPDEGARRTAATALDRNVVVRAGAGTGKTSLLVERALNVVGRGEARITELAAITFTDKAAGEMRERLAAGLERLRGLACGEPVEGDATEAERAHAHLVDGSAIEPEVVARRALAALEQLDQARVTTIHGFCSELLRDFPVDAGVDPGFTVDSGEHAAATRRACWDRFVRRELGPAATRADLWDELLRRVTLNEIEQTAHALAGFDIPGRLLEPPFGTLSAQELFSDRARALARDMAPFLAADSGVTPRSREYFEAASAALETFVEDGAEALARRLESDPVLPDRLRLQPLRPGAKLKAASPAEFDRVFRESRYLLRDLRGVDDVLAPLLLEALAPFASEFREQMLRQGQIGFTALLVLARDLLRDHRAVRETLKTRYRMLLVDEFQDTDPVQYEIVFLLAERPGECADDAFATALDPGRLFVVGDAKQSIYRFRGADYGAYSSAVEHVLGQGGVSLDLVANFRSVDGVTEPVNALFASESGPWDASAYQPEYVPVSAVRTGGSDPAVELWTFDLPERARAEVRRETEGRLIAAEIRKLVDSGECGYSEITILFRAFAPIALYLRALRRHGIPFVVDGGREFLERPEVGQLIATLRTLVSPADPTALLAFLRSPAGGLSDVELKAHRDSGGRWDWRAPLPAGSVPAVEERMEFLRRLAEELRDVPADGVVRRVVERARMLPLGAAAFEGAQRVANLRKLVLAAGELARDGRLSLEEVVEALQTGCIANLETDPPLTDDASDAVRLTSIHRMKGLENRHVILADVARELPHQRQVVAGVGVARPSGATRPVLAVTAAGRRNAAALWLQQERELHEDAEEVRVLYVALTRARDRLVVVAGPGRGPSRGLQALVPWGFDPAAPPEDGARLAEGAVLHRRMRPEAVAVAEEAAADRGGREAVERYLAAVAALEAAAAPPLVAPSAPAEEEEPSFPPPRGSGARGARVPGRAVGVAVHRLLACWDDGDDDFERRLDAIAGATALETGADAESLAREVRVVLEAYARSPLGSRVRSADVLGREVPILLREADGTTYRGSIDLLYRGADGRPVVADFKTDHETDDAELRRRYGSQLAVYARAVQRAGGQLWPPRAEIWLLRAGRCIEVPVPEV